MTGTIKIISFLFCSNLFIASLFAQNTLKPFPQHIIYSKGVIKPNHVSRQQMDDSVCAFYTNWKARYLRDDCGPGQKYIYVKGSAGKNLCVSEGQGYGMIIVALMAGYDKAAQNTYNGLFQYYKLHPSKNHPFLMAWAQTKNFEDVDGSSAADGDIDIAYSLLLANAQWGSNGRINYLEEAGSIISAILEQEINRKTFSVLLSNAIEPDSKDYFDTRSSDFMPAHFKAFGKATIEAAWKKVVDVNYTLFNLMQDKYSADAGLLPDFIIHLDSTPIPSGANYLESRYDGQYNYNACRVPWRIATDFIVNGDKRSKEIVEKMNIWIRETTQNDPANISAGYTLAGNDIKTRKFEAMSFIAPFAVAAMVDAKNQAWLNKLWEYIFSFNLDQYDYYDNSIKMFTIIILSGNYWVP